MADILGIDADGVHESAALETDSTALGVALDRVRSRRRKAEPDAADRLLNDQRGLIADQRRHLREQFRHLGLKTWSERLKLILQALTLLVGLTILGAVGLLAWQAHAADGVVIDAFTVPPDLAARGYTGQALASRIQDRLNRLQTQTQTVRPAASYSNDWGHDIKVEIPETGVSVGELQRVLRGWLGHEIHVGGDLVRTPEGLSLTVRTEDGGDEVTGSDADMGGLLQKAAEALYGRTQPYRYAAYLAGAGRMAEARTVLIDLATSGPPTEKAWALTGLARGEPNPMIGHDYARQALAQNPDLAEAWLMFGGTAQRMGDYEAGYQGQARALALMSRPDHGGMSTESLVNAGVAADHATFAGDFSGCLAAAQRMARVATKPWVRANAQGQALYCTGLVHDLSGVRRLAGGQSDEAMTRAYPGPGFKNIEYNWNAVWTEEDWAAGLQQLEGAERALRERGPMVNSYLRDRLYPLKAMALAKIGRLDEARAIVAPLGVDSYWAMVARGFIAEAAGDHAGAERLFKDCIRKAPSVAWSYGYLSKARLERGDDDGAITAARAGLKPNPRFSDLYVFWGEALLHKGDARGALAQFEKAQALTPRWGRLHLKWGEALAKLGRRDEARAHLRTAAGLDLSAAQRAELTAQRV